MCGSCTQDLQQQQQQQQPPYSARRRLYLETTPGSLQQQQQQQHLSTAPSLGDCAAVYRPFTGGLYNDGNQLAEGVSPQGDMLLKPWPGLHEHTESNGRCSRVVKEELAFGKVERKCHFGPTTVGEPSGSHFGPTTVGEPSGGTVEVVGREKKGPQQSSISSTTNNTFHWNG